MLGWPIAVGPISVRRAQELTVSYRVRVLGLNDHEGYQRTQCIRTD